MKLDDKDPLVSEWTSPAAPMPGAPTAPSLAPHELAREAGDEPPAYGPGSPEHRRRLQRYVSATVAGCVALCLAGVVRVGVSRLKGAEDAPVLVAAAHAPEAPPSPTLAGVGVGPVVPIVSASPPSPPTTAAPPHTKTAIEEREVARRSLEHGKLRDAVAAAERATAIDPTDAETWLILGAASQELGHGSVARAAFRSCVKSAKRGPVRECRAMLR